MKIDNVKLANAVKVGNQELTYFKRHNALGAIAYDIELETNGYLIKVIELKTGLSKMTSLFNTVSFDVVEDEQKTKSAGSPVDFKPRTRTPKADPAA